MKSGSEIFETACASSGGRTHPDGAFGNAKHPEADQFNKSYTDTHTRFDSNSARMY